MCMCIDRLDMLYSVHVHATHPCISVIIHRYCPVKSLTGKSWRGIGRVEVVHLFVWYCTGSYCSLGFLR